MNWFWRIVRVIICLVLIIVFIAITAMLVLTIMPDRTEKNPTVGSDTVGSDAINSVITVPSSDEDQTALGEQTDSNAEPSEPTITTTVNEDIAKTTTDDTVTDNSDFNSCSVEATSLCNGLRDGKLALVNCLLVDHYGELSDACRNSLERRQELNEELVTACAADRGDIL